MFKKDNIFSGQKEFINALNTNSGRLIMKYLYEEFCMDSALDESTNVMVYKTANKELVLGLITKSKITPSDFDNIETMEEEYYND